MHWYLVHTKPKQEKYALQNLQQREYRCYLPMLPVEKLHLGSPIAIKEPLFPRCFFVEVGKGDSAKNWALIRSTSGINRLVCFGSEPARIEGDLIDFFRIQEATFQFKSEQLPGPEVGVCPAEDAFSGIEAIYQMTEGERRVMVLIELLSKSITMQISSTDLCEAN